MVAHKIRLYYDGDVKTNRSLEEIEKDIQHWDRVSEELNEWIDPDLEQ